MHYGWFFPFGGLFLMPFYTLLWLARKSRTGHGLEGASVTLDRCLASGEVSKAQHASLWEVLH